jgi:hypothetical protein
MSILFNKFFSTSKILLRQKCFLVFISLLFIICAGCDKSDLTPLPVKVDYNFHIKPILSDRCYKCHGPDENVRKAGLRLDLKEGAFATVRDATDRFIIVPGKPASSELFYRISSKDKAERMPLNEPNLTLSEYEIALIGRWIEQGAEWKDHWSFIPPTKPELPEIRNRDWLYNPIDMFILARLETDGLTPSPEANKETLLRRVSFDLTGLPPTLNEIDVFLADDSAKAYEKAVDRLLASPAYGERMAVKWLDVARYADSHGYQDDYERTMWPWRDWVISAFNRNLPFDQFVLLQLAGDLMPEATEEQILATGFNRNHKMSSEGGIIDEEYRLEYVADRTNTTATTFLGLTLKCARCHDHKFDPISQQEYYKLSAFFNNMPEKGKMADGDFAPAPYLELSKDELAEKLPFITALSSDIRVMVMQEMDTLRKTFRLKRGAYDAPLEEVFPGTPKKIGTFPDSLSTNRLGLAKWILTPDHPLTARVTVNRFWQTYFGTGIVATPEDFGNQGAMPTHPALLDWLAVTFIESGWDVKAMQKIIVMSATYKQMSIMNADLMKRDPSNRLLARGPRYRLPAEMIRDYALAVSGLLIRKIGGPSVKPYQPEGLWAETTSSRGLTKYVQDVGESLYRRSMYTFWKRTVPPPAMMTFDATTRDLCTVRRQNTSTPLQSLVLLNDPQMIEAARHFATRMMTEGGNTPEDRISFGFRIATSRQPKTDEMEVLLSLFADQLQGYHKQPKKATQLLDVGESLKDIDFDDPESATYTVIANTLFNLYESVTKR